MTLTAGALSQVSVSSNSAKLAATAATGGTGPYTYQWYRSVTTGFTVGAGNLIAGATALTLSDTNLVPNTTYYYKVVATDTGNSNVTVEYTQLLVVTAAPSLSPNQFAQTTILGQTDLPISPGTVAVQVDSSQSGSLFPGWPVKMVDSAGGIPKVVACSANSDVVLGWINYNVKNKSFAANDVCEISMKGNVMYLYATGAIARGAQVQLDQLTGANFGVKTLTGASGAQIVGFAYDKAVAAGDLIRVYIETPKYAVAT